VLCYQEANTCAEGFSRAGSEGISLKMSERDREESIRPEEVFACFDGELVHETPAYTHAPPPPHTHIHK
jgi:hypothetical protein